MYIYCSSICTAEASTVQYMYCTVYVKQGWHAKLFILDHNFWTRNAKTSIKGLKDSNLSLVGNVNFSKTLWLSGWALGQATWTKWPKNYLTHGVTHKKSATHNQKFFFKCRLEDCQSVWALEQLSGVIDGGAMALVRQPKTAGFRLKSRYDIFVEQSSKCWVKWNKKFFSFTPPEQAIDFAQDTIEF